MQHKCLDRGGLFNDVMSNTSLKALHVSKLRLLTSIKEIQQINIEMYEPFTVVGFISSKKNSQLRFRITLYQKSALFKVGFKQNFQNVNSTFKSKKLFFSLPQRTCQQPCNGPSRTYLLQPDVGLASPGSPDPPEAAEWQY